MSLLCLTFLILVNVLPPFLHELEIVSSSPARGGIPSVYYRKTNFRIDTPRHPIPSAQAEHNRERRAVIRDETRRWKGKIIPYKISSKIKGSNRRFIQAAIRKFNKYTCLKFKPKSHKDIDHVYFRSRRGNGCQSEVGRIGGRQFLNLESPYCFEDMGTVLHEMLHAVGLVHEQNRPDRDDFIIIHEKNIEKGKEYNFAKYPNLTVDTLGLPYDYKSIMHYSGGAFSKNKKPTIETKDPGAWIGQRDGLSKKDIQQVRILYCVGKN